MRDVNKTSSEKLMGLALALRQASHLNDQKDIFTQFMQQTGFDRFFYIPLSFENDDHINLLCSNLPNAFLDDYIKNEHIFADPFVMLSRGQTLPKAWQLSQLDESKLGKQTREIKAAYQSFGLKRGLHLTIRGAYNQHAVLSVFCSKSETEFLLHSESQYLNIFSAGYLYHDLMTSLMTSVPFVLDSNSPTLTAKQHEILRLAALGKSKWETSVIIGMSEATVHYHLREVGRRLETQGVTATIAKALSLGYISL